jgi:hypothetical protein
MGIVLVVFGIGEFVLRGPLDAYAIRVLGGTHRRWNSISIFVSTVLVVTGAVLVVSFFFS